MLKILLPMDGYNKNIIVRMILITDEFFLVHNRNVRAARAATIERTDKRAMYA